MTLPNRDQKIERAKIVQKIQARIGEIEDTKWAGDWTEPPTAALRQERRELIDQLLTMAEEG